MPWYSPTLREVRSLVRDSIRGNLPGADALIPNSVLRVLSDNQGALCHLTLQYLEWLSLQIMPDTAEAEWLDRYATIWLVNSDGSTGRKMATLATGEVQMTGTIPWTIVPLGTRLTMTGGVEFETTQQVYLSTSGVPVNVRVQALDPGTIGNIPSGTQLSVDTTTGTTFGGPVAMSGINNTATVVYMMGGVDEESDDDLRYRLLLRIRQPPQGGAAHDYEQWALAVPGVTRAWVAQEMGMGTVTVRVMMDVLRADRDGFPTKDDLVAVREYLDKMRPVGVKDIFVEAPIPQRVDVVISDLIQDSPATRAGIEQNLHDLFREKAKPGQTIYSVWKTKAVMDAPGVESFDLANCMFDDVMRTAGHLPILGSIIYSADAQYRVMQETPTRAPGEEPEGPTVPPEPEWPEPSEYATLDTYTYDAAAYAAAEEHPERWNIPVTWNDVAAANTAVAAPVIPEEPDVDLTHWRPAGETPTAAQNAGVTPTFPDEQDIDLTPWRPRGE